ncbi:unnamed protein product [Trichobilharzia szidati]|nr:unnamed protein product [Trichobilharzia szidati]
MAKWGEGDPRWIVEERADAKNVNNWHWSDKDATKWSVKTIKELLLGSTFDSDSCSGKITDVSKCEGESNVHVRKGKLIFLYEWQIEIDWEGNIKGSDNKTNFKGKVEILNMSDEYTVDELDTNVSCTTSSLSGDLMRTFVKSAGVECIKSKLKEYLKLLKEEYARDLILPTKNDTNGKPTSVPQSAAAQNKVTDKAERPPADAKEPKDLSNKNLSITDEFFCTPDDLYKVFTTKELIQAFTRSEAIVDAVPGGTYSVFSGNISGVFDELVAGKTIKMRWRKREWPENHYSNLTLEMSAFEGGTRLSLAQTNVPAYDLDNTRNGWRTIFLSALKQTYGYGGRMF